MLHVIMRTLEEIKVSTTILLVMFCGARGNALAHIYTAINNFPGLQAIVEHAWKARQ